MNKLFNKKYYTPVLHLLVWVVLFSLPYLLSSGQSSELRMLVERSWIPLALYAILFYLNYFVLERRFLYTKKAVVFFIINIIIIALFIWIRFLIRNFFFINGFPGKPPGQMPPVSFFIYIDALSFILPVIFAVMLKVFERWITTEAEKKEAENARLQSELQHLRYQLQPHFFFNSLNNIYALVDLSPEKAKETILALSTLMRYLLYESNTEKIPLRKEVEFVQKYIELMELRTSGNTIIKTNFMPLPPNLEMAPLLFVPLVENAFKHGISARQDQEIVFSLYMEGNSIIFETKNKNLPKNETDRSGSGIGLQNIIKRLELIYPGAHKFTAQPHGDTFIARLQIDIKD
jgi:two-component sensor histidine kinase